MLDFRSCFPNSVLQKFGQFGAAVKSDSVNKLIKHSDGKLNMKLLKCNLWYIDSTLEFPCYTIIGRGLAIAPQEGFSSF